MMSRRDIIIVCVCFHLLLLGIIFYTALPNSAPEISNKLAVEEKSVVPDTGSQIASTTAPHREPIASPYLKPYPQEKAETNTAWVRPQPSIALRENSHPSPPPPREVAQPMALETAASEDEPPSKREKLLEITVKRGDALEKIARANHTTVKEIRSLNGLTSDHLDVGQVLFVPAPTPAQLSAASASKKPSSTKETSLGSENEYIMKPGDNLWRVARLNRMSFEELLRLNHLDEEKARSLRVGDKIRVK